MGQSESTCPNRKYMLTVNKRCLQWRYRNEFGAMTMSEYEVLIRRVRDDVQNGGSMGKASALRLLDIVAQLAQDVEKLRRDAERVKK
jgi:hypothetical protein